MEIFDLRCFDSFLRCGSMIGCAGNQLLVGWGKRRWYTLPDPNVEVSFFAPDFFLKIGLPWFVHEHHAFISLEHLNTFAAAKGMSDPIQWDISDFENFKEQFFSLQNLINDGLLSKGVPYAFAKSHSKNQPERLNRMLSKVLSYSMDFPAYPYGFWTEEEGILGATPEVLFDLDEHLTTMALAGTCKREDSLDSSKLHHEHEVVIEGISSSLQGYGDVSIGETRRLELKQISHLATTIQVALSKRVQFSEVVKALHPTPALGAFPKNQGMKWLEKCQSKLHRKRFGAPIGYLNGTKGRCLVAIRNVQWDAQGMTIGAGCGVVKASSLEEEWHEIELKIQATKDVLGL